MTSQLSIGVKTTGQFFEADSLHLHNALIITKELTHADSFCHLRTLLTYLEIANFVFNLIFIVGLFVNPIPLIELSMVFS